MTETNETIARQVRLHSHDFLCFILASDHRKWRGWKVAARAELARRSGTARLR